MQDRALSISAPHLDGKSAFTIALEHGHVLIVDYLMAKFPRMFVVRYRRFVVNAISCVRPPTCTFS